MRKTFIFFAKLSVSVALIFLLIAKIDWSEAIRVMRELNPVTIGIFSLFLIGGIMLSSYKWKILARYKGVRESYRTFFRLYLAGTFVNNFMPSFVGGDAFRVYALGKLSGNMSGAFSSVIVDRTTGLIGVMILSVGMMVAHPSIWRQVPFLGVINIGIFILLLALTVMVLTRKHRLWDTAFSFVPKKVRLAIREIVSFADHSRTLFGAIVIGMVFNVFGVAMLALILFRGIGVTVSLLDLFSVIFVISIISSIPVSINNIGIKEWAYVTFFGALGVSLESAAVVALIGRIFQMLLSFAAIPAYLQNRVDRQSQTSEVDKTNVP